VIFLGIFVGLVPTVSYAQVYRLPPELTVAGQRLPLKFYSEGPSDHALGITGPAKDLVEGNSEWALTHLTHDQSVAVERILAEINSRLSKNVKDELGSPIFLAFAPLRAIKYPSDHLITRSVFDWGSQTNPCGYPTNEEEAQEFGENIENQLLSFLFEMNGYRGKQHEKALIVLDSGFLEHITQGDSNTPQFQCGLKTFYKQAELEIFRHIGRIYDSITRDSQTDSYKNIANFSSPSFLGRMLGLLKFGWKKTETRNDYKVRTPDPREFRSPQNHYWVNFSYFHADPEYYCRRPAHHIYFSLCLGTETVP